MCEKFGFIKILFFVAIVSIFTLACNSSKGSGKGQVSFIFTSVNSQSNVKNMSRTASRAISSPNEDINNLYSNLGKLVGRYTPIEFTLFIRSIDLLNGPWEYSSSHTEIKFEKGDIPLGYAHINFMQPVPISIEGASFSGTYWAIYINFSPSIGTAFFGSIDNLIEVEVKPNVKVQIPGYEDIFKVRNVNDYAYSPISSVGDLYNFTPTYIMPSNYPEFLSNRKPFSYFSEFIYQPVQSPILYLPVKDWSNIDKIEFTKTTGLTPGLNFESYIVIPFNGIKIPENFSEIKVFINWNMENIIEVYDNKTETEKTDDILIIASDFWERLSINVVIEE